MYHIPWYCAMLRRHIARYGAISQRYGAISQRYDGSKFVDQNHIFQSSQLIPSAKTHWHMINRSPPSVWRVEMLVRLIRGTYPRSDDSRISTIFHIGTTTYITQPFSRFLTPNSEGKTKTMPSGNWAGFYAEKTKKAGAWRPGLEAEALPKGWEGWAQALCQSGSDKLRRPAWESVAVWWVHHQSEIRHHNHRGSCLHA